MIDYLAWAKADPLTVEQAARLWAEVDPSSPIYMWTPAQSAAIAACMQMLCGRIKIEELKADHRANSLSFIGRYESSLILRSDLKALAVRLDERPAFLFAEDASKSSVMEPDAETGPKTDQPPTEPPTASAAFKGLFGGPTKGPVASPPPIRIVPGARRVSSAPPPPTYVRGTVGPLLARASTVAPAAAPIAPGLKAPNPTAVARVSAETPSDDRAIKAWLTTEQARRLKDDVPCGMNEVRVYLRSEYPHLSRDDADRFYEALDPDFKPRRGPKGPWKNKR